MKFQTLYNRNEFQKNRKEKPSQLASKTIPDQVESLSTMVKKIIAGQPVKGSGAEPMYYGEEEMPDLQHMELTDRMEYLQKAQETIVKAHKEEADKTAKEKEKAENERIEQEVQKRLALKKPGSPPSGDNSEPSTE